MKQSIDDILKDEEMNNIRTYLIHSGKDQIDITTLILLIAELKTLMQEDVAQFSFRKKNGDLRTAFGTRSTEVITRHEGPRQQKTDDVKGPQSSFRYFDIEKRAWRSFSVDSILDINKNYVL